MRRRTVAALTVAIALVIGGDLAALYVMRPVEVVTVDDALQSFRSSAADASAERTDTTAASAAATPPPTEAPDATAAAPAPPPSAAAPASPPDGGGAPATAPPAPAAPAPTAPAPAAPAAPARPARPTPAPPEPGVYVYDTDGWEETDALGGAHRTYPKETAWTIKPTACGWIERWQPLRERWTETEGCTSAEGFAFSRFTMYHEFFRKGDHRDFRCGADGFVWRTAAKPGDTWSFECRTPDTTMVMKVTVVGDEPITVAGVARPTTRVRYEATMTGGIRGTNVQERWIDHERQLVLHLTNVADTRANSPFGDVAYDERFTLTLRSLSPQR